MALPKPKLNPWPYFLFSICFLASMSYLSTKPYLGPLYDCTKLHDTSYFRLPDIINCSHDMHTSNDSLQFFKASVHELFLNDKVPVKRVLLCPHAAPTLHKEPGSFSLHFYCACATGKFC